MASPRAERTAPTNRARTLSSLLIIGLFLGAAPSACGGSEGSDGAGGSGSSGGASTDGPSSGGGTGDGGKHVASGGESDGGRASSGGSSSGGSDTGGSESGGRNSGSSGEGGAGGDGGQGTSGGQGGTLEPGDCPTLKAAFDDALLDARTCLAGGIVPTTECDEGDSLQDLCGCPQAVSRAQQDARARAEAAHLAYDASCDPPEYCQLVDCFQALDSGTCQLTTHPDGVCVFQ